MLYDVAITSELRGQGILDQYVNTFEVESNLQLDSQELVDKCMNAVEFLRDTSVNLVTILTMRISTSAHEGRIPYHPEAFRIVPIGVVGSRAIPAGETVVDGNTVLEYRRAAKTGRSGRILVRYAMHTGDIEGESGRWRIKAGAGILADAGIAIGRISDMTDLKLVLIEKDGVSKRDVVSVALGSILNKQLRQPHRKKKGEVSSAKEAINALKNTTSEVEKVQDWLNDPANALETLAKNMIQTAINKIISSATDVLNKIVPGP
jgi:hypothetical protein